MVHSREDIQERTFKKGHSRKDIQERTFKRNWQHWVHKTQEEGKTKPQKTKEKPHTQHPKLKT